MRKAYLALFLFFLCSLSLKAQQKIYINLSDGKTLEYFPWEVKDITFAPVKPLVPPEAPAPVDLGLSVMWSSYNLGASQNSSTGYFVGWGDPTGMITADTTLYYPDRIVTTDIIASEFDIAKKMWGDKWRLPSKTEFQELLDSCRWEWVDSGYMVTSKVNDASIFFPAVGHRVANDTISTPTYYWTGIHDGTENANVLSIDNNSYQLSSVVRYTGCAVRPVYGEYRLPVKVNVSDASNVGLKSATVTFSISGYLQDIKEVGVAYATTMDSITNGTAKVKKISIDALPDSHSIEFTLDKLNEDSTLYYYRGFASSETDSVFSDTKQFITLTRFPKPEYVDLGLPSGIKWATWNVGARSETDYGDYLGWGDITGDLTPFSRSNEYAAGNTSEDIAGNPKYDIVNAKWGGYWRMPTREDLLELANSNYTVWTLESNYQNSGHTGYVITSTDPDNHPGHIFMPICGYNSRNGVEPGSVYYWSSEYDLTNTVAYAARLNSENDAEIQSFAKNYGFSVRGVYDEPIQYPEDLPAAANVKAIDLGLSVDWADQNIKSPSNPNEDGYFTWGSVTEQDVYNDSSYPYRNEKISDNKNILPDDHDAAKQLWGGTWRMPTLDEMIELVNDCNWTPATQNGVEGYRVTSKTTGNSIFMPCDGRKWDTEVMEYGRNGFYWTASDFTRSDPNERAYTLFITSTQRYNQGYYRTYGLPIRPVRAKRPARR